jgi:hypothetical protein
MLNYSINLTINFKLILDISNTQLKKSSVCNLKPLSLYLKNWSQSYSNLSLCTAASSSILAALHYSDLCLDINILTPSISVTISAASLTAVVLG